MLDDSHKRKSLGRGLGALLGGDMDFMTSENAVHAAGEKNVSLADLSPSPYQPRLDFDREALEALSQSVREKGVLQPLLVRERENGKYEIIAGERRFRAASMAGLTEVPVIVKSMDDKEVLEVALVENLLRENLSAIEEAEGLQRLIDEFSHTQEALSQIIGKSRSHIANTLRLLSLPASVRQMIRDGVLTAGQARRTAGSRGFGEKNRRTGVERPAGGNTGRQGKIAGNGKKNRRKRRRSGGNIFFHDPQSGAES